MQKFKVSDTVRVNEYGIGVVKYIDPRYKECAVEFPNSFPGGHDCEGHCKGERGRWFNECSLTKASNLPLPKAKRKKKPYLHVSLGIKKENGVWFFGANGKKSHYPLYEYDELRIANQQAKRLAKALGIEFRK